MKWLTPGGALKVWHMIGFSIALLIFAASVLFRYESTEARLGAGVVIVGALILLVVSVRARRVDKDTAPRL